MTNPDFEIIVDEYHKSLSRLIEPLENNTNKIKKKKKKKKKNHGVAPCLQRNQPEECPDNIIVISNTEYIIVIDRAIQTQTERI